MRPRLRRPPPLESNISLLPLKFPRKQNQILQFSDCSAQVVGFSNFVFSIATLFVKLDLRNSVGIYCLPRSTPVYNKFSFTVYNSGVLFSILTNDATLRQLVCLLLNAGIKMGWLICFITKNKVCVVCCESQTNLI